MAKGKGKIPASHKMFSNPKLEKFSNEELAKQLRVNNTNKARIFTEMVLKEREAVIFYGLVYGWWLNKEHFKGITQFKTTLSNLLMGKYKWTVEMMHNFHEEVKMGIEYAPKSKMKTALQEDIKVLENKSIKRSKSNLGLN